MERQGLKRSEKTKFWVLELRNWDSEKQSLTLEGKSVIERRIFELYGNIGLLRTGETRASAYTSLSGKK